MSDGRAAPEECAMKRRISGGSEKLKLRAGTEVHAQPLFAKALQIVQKKRGKRRAFVL